MIRVAHVTTGLSATGAGVHEAVAGLVQRLGEGSGVEPQVVGVFTDAENWIRDRKRWAGIRVIAGQGLGTSRFFAINAAVDRVDPRSVDLVHAHGLWDGAVVAGERLARKAGCPFVVSPHGMLEPWAFRHNRLKKCLPWHLWERRALASADVLEAKSDMEAAGFPAVGLHNTAAVIPVGLDLPPEASKPPSQAGSRRCVFLSRLHVKKGIDILLEAWARTRPVQWQLTIAGPDESGIMPSLRDLASRLGIASEVDFIGPVHGNAKWSLLRSADLFVLPSRSENFGIVVPEAMAVGVPCIATTATPWSLLQAEGLGWCVDPCPDALARALHQAISMPPTELEAMGDRGEAFVTARFSWKTIVRETVSLYHWLLRGGAPPSCLLPSNRTDPVARSPAN